jgi:hypothetical protein
MVDHRLIKVSCHDLNVVENPRRKRASNDTRTRRCFQQSTFSQVAEPARYVIRIGLE